MKLNNKGITLTEIIISIALISIVLIFLFSLLITVNDINDESKVNSTYLINKSLILKNIETDLRKVLPTDGITLRTCTSITEVYSSYTTDGLNENQKAWECIILDYDNDASTPNAKLGVYYYKNRTSYVISYIYGDIKATRLLPDFEKYNILGSNFKNDNFKMKINTSNSCYYNGMDTCNDLTTPGFATIKIPIIGSDGKDYSIIISYYGKVLVV